MLDSRYHLFYMIAIIMMLSFGILIGASYYGPIQVRQQKKVLDQLALETNKVVQERNEARERAGKDEAALSELRPSLVRGKMAGRSVVLIQTGDYADAVEAANTALGDAGATVAATLVLTDKWGGLSLKQRQALASIADPSDPAAQDKALLAALALALTAGSDKAASSAAVLDALKGEGLLSVSGDLSQPGTYFVLVGGSRDDAPSVPLDGPLLDGFKAVTGSITVVGCEPFTAVSSSIPAYQTAGIATVDCIDLPLGQLALPFTLRGDKGDYGLKPTAKQPLPDSLQGESTP